MLPLSTGELIMSGPLLVAAAVAAVAGAVSFFSPCCLPLVPGYLSYVAGVSGAELTGEPPAGPPEGDRGASPRTGSTGGQQAVATAAVTGAGAGADGGQRGLVRGRLHGGVRLVRDCCSVRWGPGCSPIKTSWSGCWGS